MKLNEINELLKSFVFVNPTVVDAFLNANYPYDAHFVTKKQLYLITGGIASGKSLFAYNFALRFNNNDLPFVSNDKTYAVCGFVNQQKDFDSKYDEARAYTDNLINSFVESGESFILESVLSKNKKRVFLEKCLSLGYEIFVIFVFTNDVSINLSRSHERKDKYGFRIVEDSFIEDRYIKTINSLEWLIPISTSISIIDNSKPGEEKILFHKDEEELFVSKDTPNILNRIIDQSLKQ